MGKENIRIIDLPEKSDITGSEVLYCATTQEDFQTTLNTVKTFCGKDFVRKDHIFDNLDDNKKQRLRTELGVLSSDEVVGKLDEKLDKNGGLRTGFSGNGILSVENGTEKVLNNLPQGMVDGIKTPILTEVGEKLDAEKVYVEGVVRETIPNALTPVCFVDKGSSDGGKMFHNIIWNGEPIKIDGERQFIVKKVYYTSSLWYNPTSVIFSYNDVDISMNFQSSPPYYSISNINREANRFHIKNVPSSLHGKIHVIIETQNHSSPGIYIYRNFNTLIEQGLVGDNSRFIGFLKNKQYGETVKILDVKYTSIIDVDLSDGVYFVAQNRITQNPQQTEWSVNTWEYGYLQLGEVKNKKMYMNIQNYGYISSGIFACFGLLKKKDGQFILLKNKKSPENGTFV